MKIFIICSMFLFLMGCGPSDFYNLIGYRRFKVGDCLMISNEKPESWEIGYPSYKVLELGKYSYRIERLPYSFWKGMEDKITYGHLWEDFYQKVPCGN